MKNSAWLDTGTHDSLIEAGEFVRIIQQRQGLRIACLEEIGFLMGYLGEIEFEKSIQRLGKSSYGNYLRGILERNKQERTLELNA